jgi:hypothetical protein
VFARKLTGRRRFVRRGPVFMAAPGLFLSSVTLLEARTGEFLLGFFTR